MNGYITDISYSAEPLDRSKLNEFINDSLRRVSLVYLAVLLLAGVVSCGIYLATDGTMYGAIWPNQIVYYLVLGFHILYRISKSRVNILSPDMLFLVFYTMFHLGYVTLFSLNLVPQSNYIFHYDESIPRSMFVINLGLLGFMFGYEIMGARAPVLDEQPPITIPGKAWEAMGIFFMALSMVMHFIGLNMLGWGTISRYGYHAIQAARFYSGQLTVSMLAFSIPVMMIGATIYIIASSLKYGKLFKSRLALILVVTFLGIIILEGDRGPIVKIGIPILLVRHFFVKAIKARYLMIIFAAALILFAGLAVVRTTVFQPGKMFQEYKYKKSAGEIGWYAPFVEMGGSFMIVNIVTQDVPGEEPYWMGASWRDAAIHIIPFMQGFAARRGYTKWSPSLWITNTYFGYGAAGRAFTVAAEGYLNFGFPGAFTEVMLVGMFIRWLMIYFSRSPSAARALIFLGCVGVAVMVTRNHFNLLFAACFQIFVVAWLLNMLLGNEPQPDDEEMAEHSECIADS